MTSTQANYIPTSDLLLDAADLRAQLAAEWLVHEIIQYEINCLRIDYKCGQTDWQFPQEVIDDFISLVRDSACLEELEEHMAYTCKASFDILSRVSVEKPFMVGPDNWAGWDHDWCKTWPGGWHYLRRIAFEWLEGFCARAAACVAPLTPEERSRISEVLWKYPRACASIIDVYQNAWTWLIEDWDSEEFEIAFTSNVRDDCPTTW